MTDGTLSGEDASFARALARLYLNLIDIGAWPPRDVSVDLCEERNHVVMMASDAAGHWVTSGFDLDETTDEETFFPRSQRYVDWIENGVELQRGQVSHAPTIFHRTSGFLNR